MKPIKSLTENPYWQNKTLHNERGERATAICRLMDIADGRPFSVTEMLDFFKLEDEMRKIADVLEKRGHCDRDMLPLKQEPKTIDILAHDKPKHKRK